MLSHDPMSFVLHANLPEMLSGWVSGPRGRARIFLKTPQNRWVSLFFEDPPPFFYIILVGFLCLPSAPTKGAPTAPGLTGISAAAWLELPCPTASYAAWLGALKRTGTPKWVWVKMNPPGDGGFDTLIPFTRVPFGYLFLTHSQMGGHESQELMSGRVVVTTG